MSTEPTLPTRDELNVIRQRAGELRAEAFRATFAALVRWLAHPRLHARRA